MTNFDLLGDFGRIEWLGNFKLVLFYNLIFATAAIDRLFGDEIHGDCSQGNLRKVKE